MLGFLAATTLNLVLQGRAVYFPSPFYDSHFQTEAWGSSSTARPARKSFVPFTAEEVQGAPAALTKPAGLKKLGFTHVHARDAVGSPGNFSLQDSTLELTWVAVNGNQGPQKLIARTLRSGWVDVEGFQGGKSGWRGNQLTTVEQAINAREKK